MKTKPAYTVRIVGDRDWQTLLWLSARGYDAGLYDLAQLEDFDGEVHVLSLSEPAAWEYSERVSADIDTGTFLSCNGSYSLHVALMDLWDSIV